MIGFDRPVKPEWIYETLKMIKMGEKPSVYNEPFEDITKELIGKEGKRKVRTVIFRSFIYSMQNSKRTIKDNYFIRWVKESPLDEIKPLLLLKLLMDYEICRFIIRKISLSVQPDGIFSTEILKHEMVREYGDRDVVKRSLRSLIATLHNFKVITKVDTKTYRMTEKYSLGGKQIMQFLLLYGKNHIGSQMIDIDGIEPEFSVFFDFDLMKDSLNEYSSELWNYVREAGREIIYLK